jgi:hypothetical protein
MKHIVVYEERFLAYKEERRRIIDGDWIQQKKNGQKGKMKRKKKEKQFKNERMKKINHYERKEL